MKVVYDKVINMKKYSKQKNKLFKRTVSFATALALLCGVFPLSEVSDTLRDLVDYAIVAMAASDIQINSVDDLIKYSNGIGEFSYSPKDTIKININAGQDDELSKTITDGVSYYTFQGIGTAEAPFEGKIVLANVEGDDGGASQNIILNGKALFNYITTDAKIVDSNTSQNACSFALTTGTDGTNAAMFAENVIAGDSKAEWSFLSTTNYAKSSLFKTVGSNAKLDITYHDKKSNISGTGNLGLICGTMESGSEIELSLSYDADDMAEITEKNTGSGYVGGLVGYMKENSTLTVKKLDNFANSKRTITAVSNSNAGGLVGKCEKGDLQFTNGAVYDASAECSITSTGNTLAGAVFGYYELAEGITRSIDASAYRVTGLYTLTGNHAGGFAGDLRICSNSTSAASNFIIDGKGIGNFNISVSNTGGGIVGNLFSENSTGLKNTIIIKNVKTTVKSDNKAGGVVGDLGLHNNVGGQLYLRVEGTNELNVNNGTNSGGAGMVRFCYSSFLDVAGENTITGVMNAGVVGECQDYKDNSCVIRLSGKTNLSGANITGATLVSARNTGSLIYALGSGSDYIAGTESTPAKGWTLIRPSDATKKIEDINPWGQVVRTVKYSVNGTEKTGSIEDAEVITPVSGIHAFTLSRITPSGSGSTYELANSADFAKLALNIQLNDITVDRTAGALRTSANMKTSTFLDNSGVTIKLTGDIDLSGTGLRGFTRDYNEDKFQNAFTGTLDGNGKSITLAIGEAYGYRGDTLADNNDTDGKNGNTGAVYTHRKQGLFVIFAGTAKDLTLLGNEYVYFENQDFKSGGIAALFTGNTTLTNVKAKFEIVGNFANGNNSSIAVGNLLGCDEHTNTGTNANDTAAMTLALSGCEVEHKTKLFGGVHNNNNQAGTSVGAIARLQSKATTVNIDDFTIGGTIENNINNLCGYGGLIGTTQQQKKGSSNATDTANTVIQNITLTNIKVNGFKIADNSTNERTGGLLGGYWNSVNVIIGKNESHSEGITVTDSKIDLNGDKSKIVGGLVTTSTGFWQVNDLNYTTMSIVKGANGKDPSVVGLIVGRGDQYGNSIDNTHRLYLEITDPNAYTIGSTCSFPSVAEVYDEIVGKTIISSDGFPKNGEGFVSVRTSGDVLNMTNGETSNEYKPQTDLGKTQANQWTRYYYDLDYLLEKVNKTGGDKATLWSAYTFAANNIKGTADNQHNKKIAELHTKGFNDYNSFPADEIIDLTGLSYYPVDISDSVELNGRTVKLYNKEIESAHGDMYSTRAYSQQYLMHCGAVQECFRFDRRKKQHHKWNCFGVSGKPEGICQ